MTGRVLFFNNAKGWGFIKRDDSAKDIFAHFSEVQQEGYKSLRQDDEVSFDVGQVDGRTVATNIVVTQEAPRGR